MAIDPKQIKSDFTLELDQEQITVGEFTRAVDGFFGLIREVSRAVFPAKDISSWDVKVYPGSGGIGVKADRAELTPQEVNTLKSEIVTGLILIEQGKPHRYFGDKALEHVRTIGNLAAGKEPKNIRLWYGAGGETSTHINHALSLRVSEFLQPAYESEGSIDGFLERLNAHDKFEFVVYEVISNRAVKCAVDENMLANAQNAFRKRVEVMGRVKYRKDGKPVSVRAREIVPFPSKESIPSLDEIRNILAGS